MPEGYLEDQAWRAIEALQEVDLRQIDLARLQYMKSCLDLIILLAEKAQRGAA